MPDRVILVDQYSWTSGGSRYSATPRGAVVSLSDAEAARGDNLDALGVPAGGEPAAAVTVRAIESLPDAQLDARSATIGTGSVAVGESAADVAVTWDTPFADANYAVVASVEQDVADAGLRVRRTLRHTDAGCVVRIENTDTLNAASGTLHVVALR